MKSKKPVFLHNWKDSVYLGTYGCIRKEIKLLWTPTATSKDLIFYMDKIPGKADHWEPSKVRIYDVHAIDYAFLGHRNTSETGELLLGLYLRFGNEDHEYAGGYYVDVLRSQSQYETMLIAKDAMRLVFLQYLRTHPIPLKIDL